jgi:serine phosphatase RsbU (regulator of sigma subunit)
MGSLFLRSTSHDDAHFEVVRQLGFESYMCLPLMGGTRVVGTLTLVAAGSGRSFGARDLAEAEEFARRAGTAIERARLYQREHHVAETLQRSLLPERLPTVSGLQMTGRYIAGSEGMDIGGDWSDVVHLPDDTVMVVVGDVMGRGVRAASLMGQLRDAVRVYTTEGLGPAAIATRVNAFVEMFAGDMATFVCAVIDPKRRALRYTRAGHPPPLVLGHNVAAGRSVGGDRDARFAEDAGSVPVGLFPDAVYEEATVVLEPGTTIVLYTDGLVERPDADMDEGFARLVEVAVAARHDDPDELADSILDAMLGSGRRRDDVALLIVRVTA